MINLLCMINELLVFLIDEIISLTII